MVTLRLDLPGAVPAGLRALLTITLLCMVGVILLISSDVAAQDVGSTGATQMPENGEWCGTQKLWELKSVANTNEAAACIGNGPCDIAGTRNAFIPEPDQSMTIIRLMFHIITLDDGSNPSTTPSMIAQQVANLNADYAPLRVSFEYDYRTHASTAYRSLNGGEFDLMKEAYAIMPDSQMNVFVSYVEESYSYGTFPWDGDALTARGGIVMTTGHFSSVQSTLAHEVGHCLGLWHTHHGVSEVNQCSDCYEKAASGDGDVTGDFCEDTEPTPLSYACGGPGGSDPCNGQPWGATDPQNYMGYAGEGCWSEFSPQQRGRMHCWINDRLLGWSSGVRFNYSNTLGEAPLTVDFEGITAKTVNDWNWTFGDGQSSTEQSPSHMYNNPGQYDVRLTIDAVEGTYEAIRRELVWAHKDTLKVATVSTVPGTSQRIDIYAHNYLPVQELLLPVSWDGPATVTFDSVSTAGLRTAYMAVQDYAHYDDYSKRITYRLAISPSGMQSPLAAGTGPVLSVYLTAAPGTVVDNPVSLISYSTAFQSYAPTFTVLPGNYGPTTVAGKLKACLAGDVNNDGIGPDVTDLSFLIGFLTGSVPQLPNPATANVNGTGPVDISDLSYFILFMVGGGAAPVCP
ncbi:MAG: PKD domain-containing protein [bacterium]|nr:PKD domain-containing protein [bacterium]